MFASCPSQNTEDFFTNVNYSKDIDCIIPTTELFINFKINGMRARKPCLVYAEKLDFKGLIQLRLIEKCDQRRMYITTVDSASFPELKHEQSLHVTFSGFIENLVKLLQECQASKLEIHLAHVQDVSGRVLRAQNLPSNSGNPLDEFQLQFVESRSFKNLIHLSLPCRLAPVNVVMFYMNNIMDAMQKKIVEQDLIVQKLQQEINMHLHRLEKVSAENSKLHENILETTRRASKQHSEEVEHLQDSLRKCSEQRQNDNEHSRKTIASLQSQIEKLSTEKFKLQSEKSQEQRRCGALNEELTASKTHLNTLREHNEKLVNEITALKNGERKNEMHLNELRKHIGELQEKTRKYDKAKADLVAELEAEKKITQNKRHALEMATEEISKANEIILKQSQELSKMKKTIACRTEIALQQEKAIQEKEKLLSARDEEFQLLQQTIESLRKEIPEQLMSMRAFASSLEKKYTDQIRALRERLTEADQEKIASNPRVTLSANRHR